MCCQVEDANELHQMSCVWWLIRVSFIPLGDSVHYYHCIAVSFIGMDVYSWFWYLGGEMICVDFLSLKPHTLFLETSENSSLEVNGPRIR